MIYVRICACLFISYLGYLQVKEQVATAFSDASVIKIDGILNIWASFGMLFVFSYLGVYFINEKFSFHLPIGNLNKIGILIIIVIAPMLSTATYVQSNSNVSGYIECKNERKLSSRYSSRTYAISPELCTKIAHRKGT